MFTKDEIISGAQMVFNLPDLKIVKPYHHNGAEYVLIHEFFGEKIPQVVFLIIYTTHIGEPHIYRTDVGTFVSFDLLAIFIEAKLKLDELTINEKKRPSPCSTYIMFDEHTECYKIGKSVNPKHREKTLQSEKPSIKMVLILTKNIEIKLHKLFNSKRVRGEWFKLNADDLLLLIEQYGFKEPQ